MNWKSSIIAILPLLGFLIFFFYWPVLEIIRIAVGSDLETWRATFEYPLFKRFFSFTIYQAVFTVIGALIIGLPAGYLLARSQLYFENLLRAAITVPFLFPPLVILLGFVVLFEPEGLLSGLIIEFSFDPFSFWGIVMAHTLYNISLVARITESGFASEPSGYHHVADSLGAGQWQKFRTITFPHIRSSVLSAMLLTFLYSFNSFAIVLILGEVKLQTIEVMIYAQSRLRLNISRASILALFQMFLNLLVIVGYMRFSRKTSDYEISEPLPRTVNPIIGTSLLLILTIVTWMPVFMVFKVTVTGLLNAPDLVIQQLLASSYDRFLGTSSLRVIGNTLFFGVVVSAISIILSLCAVISSYVSDHPIFERLTVPLVLLPMGTSAITTSFALLQTHGHFSFFNELVFIYIISAQLIAALPFASRAIFSSWDRVPKDLLLVSSTLGASSTRTFSKVVFPFLKSSILVAFLFSFAISIGEFGATYYLVRGEWTTLSLAIDRLFSSRTTLLPNLYASFLVLFSLILFWLIEKMGTLELKI